MSLSTSFSPKFALLFLDEGPRDGVHKDKNLNPGLLRISPSVATLFVDRTVAKLHPKQNYLLVQYVSGLGCENILGLAISLHS